MIPKQRMGRETVTFVVPFMLFSGAAKAEVSPEAIAALDALPPTERLLADIQAAFEAADVPMSDFNTLDAGALARLLSPSIVARSARLLLKEKRSQWACRRVVVVVVLVVVWW